MTEIFFCILSCQKKPLKNSIHVMAHEIINNFRAKISIEFCCTNNYHLVWISVLNFFSHLPCSTYLKLRFVKKATKKCRNFPFIFDTKGVSVCKPRVVFHEKNRNSLFKFLCITIHNKNNMLFIIWDTFT